ncbi:hypothetical protein [Dankookia sp. P2]|uniref:hypothetical protein n=1 Tax=Dankookia sp. P2 TaxID=3423955 RepID=UPI003D6737FD
MTDRVNEHNRKLHPTATISGTAAALAEWMARTSSDGLHEPYADLDEVAAALGPDHSLSDIENAAEELSSYGLLDFSRYIGGGAVKPGWRLFAVVDPHEKGWILEQDARTLASIVLDVQDSFSASELEQRSGFERRRFNPAFSRLLTLFDPESVINEIQPNYPATCAYLSGGTRARLRRFVKGE